MTPLLLVTGFLGAGKTTFLRGLIPALARRGRRARVILNDYADARIDAATLADLLPDLVALSGSCVCCESLDDLLASLAALECGPKDVVVVEANGGTESGELLALLAEAPGLDRLSPPLQLTVIDAKRFGARGWQNTMEREQLETATHTALGRLDLVPPARAAEVAAAVAAIAPRARPVTPDEMAAALVELAPVPRPRGGGHHLDHDHRHPFAAHVSELPTPVDADAFLAFLAALPPEVLRAKGVVILRDPPGEKRSFQKVEGEAEISPCELATPEAIAPRAVFVGPALPVSLIEERLGQLLGYSRS